MRALTAGFKIQIDSKILWSRFRVGSNLHDDAVRFVRRQHDFRHIAGRGLFHVEIGSAAFWLCGDNNDLRAGSDRFEGIVIEIDFHFSVLVYEKLGLVGFGFEQAAPLGAGDYFFSVESGGGTKRSHYECDVFQFHRI